MPHLILAAFIYSWIDRPAACAAFGTDAGLGIANALGSMITSISNAISVAVA